MSRRLHSWDRTLGYALLGGSSLFAGLSIVLRVSSETLASNPIATAVGLTASAAVVGAAVARHTHLAGGVVAAYVLIWLSLAPLLQLQEDHFPTLVTAGFTGRLPPTNHTAVQTLIAVGFIAFGIAYHVGTRSPGSSEPPPFNGQRRASSRRAFIMLAAVFPVAIVVVATVLDLSYFFRHRDAQTAMRALVSDGYGQAVSGLLEAGITVPALVVMLVAIAYRRANPGRNAPARVFLLSTVAANLILNFPLSASRAWLMAIVVSTIVVAFARGSIRRESALVRALPLVVVVGSVIAFPYLDFFRNTSGSPYDSLSPRGQLVNSADYDSYAQIANGLSLVEQDGHTFGGQLVGSLLVYVPSFVWSGKPPHTGELIGQEVVGNEFTNLSAPLWIEGYIDAGVLGTMSFLAVLGFGCARIDKLLGRRFRPLSSASLLAAFLAGYLPIAVRGALLPALPRLIAFALVCWVVSRASSLPSRDTIPVAAGRATRRNVDVPHDTFEPSA